jgi:acyl-CoA reductase-like NAD-dependent aldehyde dehydrogenase
LLPAFIFSRPWGLSVDLAARRIAGTERKRREEAVMEASSSRRTRTSRKSSPNGARASKSTSKRSKAKAKPKQALESFNPATGELIGTVETITPAKVQGIVDDVAEVQPFWAALTLDDRARYMRRAVDVLLSDLDEIAELLSNEQGKPRVESYTMELLPTVDSLKWISDNGPRILSDEKLSMPLFLKSKSAKFTFEPIGVVGVIAPWNYPWSIPFGEVAIALMAGNGVVLKPASLTPLIGDRIRQTFEKAGLPEGLVRTVHGGGRIGDALVKSTAGKIFFTGSVEVGKKVGVECAKRMKGSVLELGGKDPQIVCADADLANAVSGAVWGGFANAGQTCSGIERVYVVDQVADAFLDGVVRETERLTVGDPREWTTEIGPMVSDDQAKIVTELVDDAVKSGATKLTGGPRKVDGMTGSFIAPIVLTGVTHEMRIMNEEIFGPVLPVMTVGSEEEAVRLANDSQFGLGASVWTKDRAKGERMAHQIESGMVWVNDHSFSHGACQCAWGGVKDSGLGRSHSKFGFYECVNIKQLAWEPGWTRDMWWQPYDRKLGDAIRSSAQILYSRNGNRLAALREGFRPLVEVTRRTMRKGQ